LYMMNAHMCASSGIIGPISDLLHLAEYDDWVLDIDEASDEGEWDDDDIYDDEFWDEFEDRRRLSSKET